MRFGSVRDALSKSRWMPITISPACSVRDHGIGIAPDQQSKIFERFERGAEQRSGGFGIGLWIVRNICVAMGGAVSVESTLGEGACFTVMLPRRPARQAVESASE